MQHLWIQGSPAHSTNVNVNMPLPQTGTDLKIWMGFGKVSIPVVAFGRSWLAVDKPCGMSIHLPGDAHASTLQSDGMPEAMRQLLEVDR